MDRMYIGAHALGLSCDYYNTDNIRDAELNGKSIINSRARRLKEMKTYLDLTTMTVVSGDEELAHLAADLVADTIGVSYEAGPWDRRIQMVLDNPGES
jgi:hypothetical protein